MSFTFFSRHPPSLSVDIFPMYGKVTVTISQSGTVALISNHSATFEDCPGVRRDLASGLNFRRQDLYIARYRGVSL